MIFTNDIYFFVSRFRFYKYLHVYLKLLNRKLMANADEASQKRNEDGANGRPIGVENTEFLQQLNKRCDTESHHLQVFYNFIKFSSIIGDESIAVKRVGYIYKDILISNYTSILHHEV